MADEGTPAEIVEIVKKPVHGEVTKCYVKYLTDQEKEE